MTINERRKYIHKMWERYRKAKRNEKGILLEEMEQVTGMHRKSLIRLLNGNLSRKKRVKQRGREYGVGVENAVRRIAQSLDHPCAERLKPNLVWMAQHLEKHGEMHLSQADALGLEHISIATLKRMLQKVGNTQTRIAYRQPAGRRVKSLRKNYPMRRIPCETVEAGHFEVDLVCHSGEQGSGEFINTLQMVDVATGWSELEAVFGKSFKAIQDGFQFILGRLPFPILELHPDNGSEFFNHHLIRFWGERVQGLVYTRSRPYHKNDNRFVEENNHSLIRAYVGHGRFDTLAHLEVLRKLYQCLWLYHNFFLPVMRTKEKIFLDELRYRRVFDQARPPLDRLLETGALTDQARCSLLEQRSRINPFALRDQIEELVSTLVDLPLNRPDQVVHIDQTLRKEHPPLVTLSFEPVTSFR